MVQVTPNPREGDPKMSEEKRAKEAPGGPKTPKPEVHNMRFEWSALPAGQASDILAYKSQRRQGDVPQGVQTVPAVWVPSPQGAPWQYSGITEDGLAVKKFNFMNPSNSNDTDDAPVSQHIHEHHHYGHRYSIIPNQAKAVRYERQGYLVKVDTTGAVTAPPLPIPNQDPGLFRTHNNQRPIDNGPYYQQYGPHYNCPYYAEYPNAAYQQPQIVPYQEVNAIDQHYHIHQHYYHPHYQYQSMKYQQSQISHHHHPRFLAHHHPRFHAHQHAAPFPYQHARPYFAYNEGFNWFSQGPFPRPSYVQSDYDLSALKEVLRTL